MDGDFDVAANKEGALVNDTLIRREVNALIEFVVRD